MTDIFKDHVGIKNAISSEDLFFKVLKVHADSVDFYERQAKWHFILRILGALRKNGTLFVISNMSYHYVLNDREELDTYKSRTDGKIKGLHNMKTKAERWVDSDTLKELKALKVPARR